MALFGEHELDTNPEDVEKLGEYELIPEGFYRASLESSKQEESKTKATPFIQLGFKLLEGPAKDKLVKEDLFLPGTDDEADKRAKKTNRKLLFAERLGILETYEADGKDDKGEAIKVKKYKVVEGKSDFKDCLGTECVIHVTVDKNDKPDAQGRVFKPKNRIDYAGIYKVNDPRIPDLKSALAKKLAGAPAGGGGTSAGKKAEDYDV